MKITVSTLILLTLVSLLPWNAQEGSGQEPPEPGPVNYGDYSSIQEAAEQFYARKSFQRAYDAYLRARDLQLDPDQTRWVEFRLADTLWRSKASTQSSDPSQLEEAQRQLQELLRKESKDVVAAEIHQSLGDYHWMRRNARNWHLAWPYYQKALDYWAGSRDLEVARQRYLQAIFSVSLPHWQDQGYYYGYYGNYLPLPILQNTLNLARTEAEKTRAHYLLATTLAAQGNWTQKKRASRHFEAALETGRSMDWYDDALFRFSQFMSNTGRIRLRENGQWYNEPDYIRAVELLRRLLRDYSKGETRYYDQAKRQLQEITGARIGIGVSSVFLPDSEIQFHLNWRNVHSIRLELYPIDLVDEVSLHLETKQVNWIDTLHVQGRPTLKTWARPVENEADHQPGSSQERLEKLPPGAYLLVAKAGGKEARDRILVSESSLVLKTHGSSALLYMCSAQDGSPVAGAEFSIWRYSSGRDRWQLRRGRTGDDGVARVRFTREGNNSHSFFAAVSHGDQQAFSQGHGYSPQHSKWKVYVLTDRPAYRPGEEAHWKLVARLESPQGYSTPSDQELEIEITDPKGVRIEKTGVTLNRFGSGWGSLELTQAMPLGEYKINFWDQGRKNWIGSETLLRLEEYKLPEFRVQVEPPREEGHPRVFSLGEEVEVKVLAEYYFGGPVVGAEVEIIVFQRPFQQYWRPPDEFSWLRDADNSWNRQYGGWRGQEVKRVTVKTDEDGSASVTIDTSTVGLQDVEFEIEARVRDSSRREVVSSGRVRVTRQRYFAYLQPDHHLYRPGDKVELNIHTLDANQRPLQAEGTVTVYQSRWEEIWIDHLGRESSAAELRRRQAGRSGVRLPPGWRLKYRGYRDEELLSRRMRTDEEGQAELAFSAKSEGYYRIRWVSDREADFPVRSETQVWVGERRSQELGYRHGGLEIVLDRDTARVGQPLTAMLASHTSDRWVLLSVEAEDLYSYQVVHLEGTVKLVQIDIEAQHVPNVFLRAFMVSDAQIHEDTKQLIVPPSQNAIQVEIVANQDEYLPRKKGQMTLITRDEHGNPVSAEVAFGVVDDSVYAIQDDYASDPLRFFFGRKRSLQVQTQSTFQQKRYLRLEEDADGNLIMAGNRQDLGGGIAGVVSRGAVGQDRRSRSGRLENFAADAVMAESESRLFQANASMEMAAGYAVARKAAAAPQSQATQPVQVRSDFSTTILWTPDVITGEDGKAIIPVTFNDTLTTWRATARAITSDDHFGQGTTSVITNQPLMVRLQSPRFFLTGDTVTVSAVVNNNTGRALRTSVELLASGLGSPLSEARKSVSIEADGDTRVDWRFKVEHPGETRLKVVARAANYSDAMEKVYPVFEHGIEKLIATSGKSMEELLRIPLDLPARKPESTRVTVQVTPSLAVTMLDALPYLIDYPYGCTEQTMSRFLPAAITARTLRRMGLEPADIAGKLFGGIEAEPASQTHRKGPRDLRLLDDMIEKGLQRLYDFQHSDGGWGWWKEGDSDHFMTAYVVWGLSLALEAEMEVKSDVLQRAARFLDQEIVEAETTPDLQAWMLHGLSAYRSVSRTGPSSFQVNAFNHLWNNRERLNAYTRALLALSAHQMNNPPRAHTLIENLENGVKRDQLPLQSQLIQRSSAGKGGLPTAHWGEDGIHWRWSEGGVEATAFALRALLQISPDHELVDPVINWLIKNRRGAQWSNTRDTAIVVLALNDYLGVRGELEQEVGYEVLVNGEKIAERHISGAELLSAPSRFAIDPDLIRDQANQIEIRRTDGEAPLYYMVEARFFSLEEPIQAEGYEIFSQREYYRLVPRPTLLNGHVLERIRVQDGETLKSGERLEVVLRIEAKNNYEYLVFEDLKPAGLEAVALRSGGPVYARQLRSSAVSADGSPGEQSLSGTEENRLTGRTRWVHRELRDRKVAFFIDKLPEGFWELRYELRAETPGDFHALPLLGYAMYVPEIRTNSEEIRVSVAD